MKIVRKLLGSKLTALIMFLFIPLILTSFKQCTQYPDYQELENFLDRANLILILPKGHRIMPIIENRQCSYNIAFKLSNGIEVRYAIIPYDSMLIEYNEYLEEKSKGIKYVDPIKGEYTKIMSDPTNMYTVLFHSFVFNISEKQDITFEKVSKSIQKFPDEAVKKEFNADVGYHAWCDLDKEFGQNYKVCNIFMIHKKDLGMVVCFRLYKNWEQVKKFIDNKEAHKAFYCCQFFKANAPIVLHPRNIQRIYFE